jgi:hypothetical protein
MRRGDIYKVYLSPSFSVAPGIMANIELSYSFTDSSHGSRLHTCLDIKCSMKEESLKLKYDEGKVLYGFFSD